ncbi:LYR motif-containing 1 [Micractinium conductrix]|uniref:LYR motif-containing 1 n=1 Tax=Micractinium conductrix TaxID=554055 RepID=A0A2P6VQP5_9CHLO|nr:LYR motif-containing 1 [Micractinium conductrix]|eukprot:PSC76418.1 LYR motif-containing 1 [Micractinium conductrix]
MHDTQWQGSAEEAEYIRTETRQQFRAQLTASGDELAAALEEGERRLELGLHYGIAYPRLFHADQFEKVPYWQKPQLEGDVEAVAAGVKDPGVAARLAAAAARRRQRLAAQQQQQQGGGIGSDEPTVYD